MTPWVNLVKKTNIISYRLQTCSAAGSSPVNFEPPLLAGYIGILSHHLREKQTTSGGMVCSILMVAVALSRKVEARSMTSPPSKLLYTGKASDSSLFPGTHAYFYL